MISSSFLCENSRIDANRSGNIFVWHHNESLLLLISLDKADTNKIKICTLYFLFYKQAEDLSQITNLIECLLTKIFRKKSTNASIPYLQSYYSQKEQSSHKPRPKIHTSALHHNGFQKPFPCCTANIPARTGFNRCKPARQNPAISSNP